MKSIMKNRSLIIHCKHFYGQYAYTPYAGNPLKFMVLKSMIFLFLAVCLTGCISSTSVGPEGPAAAAVTTVAAPGKITTCAVSYIYEAETGNINELGNYYRDMVEKQFRKKGYQVKARRDIVLLIDDAETFGSKTGEDRIWKDASADIVVCGSYQIIKPEIKNRKAKIRVSVKAFSSKGADLVESYTIEETLDKGWQRLAAAIHGNVFKQKFEHVTGTGSSGPPLKAELDRKPACYNSGDSATISIKSHQGAHIYIFNIAADNTVTLLYPNKLLEDQPLTSDKLKFPPEILSDKLRLVLYPLEKEGTSRESFKIIASDEKMDFSFLPVPFNRVYQGISGTRIKKLDKVLKSYNNFSEKTLTYFVGADCR